MTAFELKRIAWWEGLSDAWRRILIKNLDLEGFFDLKDLCYLDTLESLDCNASSIRSLDPLQYFPYLKELNLSNTAVSDFQGLKYVRHLKKLDLSFCSGIDLQKLSALTSLEILDISYPGSDIRNPEKLSSLPALKYVNANACKEISLLRMAKAPQLSFLSMEFCYLGEMEVNMFESLKPNCVLKY